jgi:glucose-1-phosphate thymidylyltransferase
MRETDRHRVIGIVPAAGYATRLGNLPRSKELLEVNGVPVIEYLVRRMEVAGCSEIRVVTRPEKEDVRDYAARRGATVLLAHPAHVGASVAAALEGVSTNALVALGYPDTLWEPLDGFVRLRDAVDSETDVVLGLFRTLDAARSDVVVTDSSGRVADILVKPSDPPSMLVWGCLVASAFALADVGSFSEVSDSLKSAIARRRVASRWLSKFWLDVGVPAALEKARTGAFPAMSL